MKLILKIKKDKIKIKNICKALSDLTRIDIIHLIIDDKDDNLNYGAIAEGIGRSPTAVTNHMSWIRQAKLIEDQILEGKRGKMQKIPRLLITEIVIQFE